MLVSGLINEALSTKISSSHGGYAGVHQALCECAQEMVDKYRQKQETPENKSKLEVKTRAATILHQELCKVSKGTEADAIHEALSSALERHAAELQGYEHLVSEKSSNYALVKQTQGLRQQAGAPVSLLRYHNLKNNLLGPDSPLSDELKEFISEWSEKKILKLDMKSLDLLNKDPGFFTKDMIKDMSREMRSLERQQAGRPELASVLSGPTIPFAGAMKSLAVLHKEELFRLGFSEAEARSYLLVLVADAKPMPMN